MKKERKAQRGILIKNLMNSKRGQFYLIAAAIIIAILIALTSTSNLVVTKNNQAQVELRVDQINSEAVNLINYAYTNRLNDNQLQAKIEELGNTFSEYISASNPEQFGLYILYGKVEHQALKDQKLNGASYVQKNSGSVNLDNMQVTQTNDIVMTDIISNVYTEGSKQYINVTISGRIYKAEVSNNNFMIVLTTSDGFSNYVSTNIQN
ncbi:hypothetical protein FJZ17_04475 [Candidatus Pacearchaeota archaeon]|nr:hypothetical protein [Candidatus Pacearchaeota archaeon]